MSEKQKKPKCYNCKFAGTAFKWVGMTHNYCEHPDNSQAVENGADGRDFIMCWYDTCEKHEFKQTKTEMI